MAVDLWWLFRYAPYVEQFDAGSRRTLSQYWTLQGNYLSMQASLRIVCVVFAAVPLAGLAARFRPRQMNWAYSLARLRRVMRRTALVCLAGVLTTVLLTLAIGAVAHADVTEPVRWSGIFAPNLRRWDEQAAVVIAAICAAIAAVYTKATRFLVAGLGVAVIVAAAGTFIAINVVGITSCFTPLSVQFTRPPAIQCMYLVQNNIVFQDVLLNSVEAVLIAIILIPGAQYLGRRLPRSVAKRAGWPNRTKLLQLAAISAAFGAVIAAAALQLDSASARNIQPAGSIGRDGWISGNGYEFRMYPLWYERATVGAGSQLMLTNEPDMAEMTIAEDSVQDSSPANKQLLSGVQPITLDGVHGLRGTLPGTGGDTIEQWRVTRGSSEYVISVQAPVAAFPVMKHGLTFMLSTWHWSG